MSAICPDCKYKAVCVFFGCSWPKATEAPKPAIESDWWPAAKARIRLMIDGAVCRGSYWEAHQEARRNGLQHALAVCEEERTRSQVSGSSSADLPEDDTKGQEPETDTVLQKLESLEKRISDLEGVNKTESVSAGEGYRLLAPGERIRRGDEYQWAEGRWEPTERHKMNGAAGVVFGDGTYRRKLSVSTALQGEEKC